MEYKGYTGILEVDEEQGTLYGRVVGLRDLITFEGRTVEEAEREFHTSVDVYLEWCEERGESPEKPYSGRFVVRIEPWLHRELAHAAEERGVSLNSLVEEHLRAATAKAAPRRAGKGGIVHEPGHEYTFVEVTKEDPGAGRPMGQGAPTAKGPKVSRAAKRGKD